MSLEERLVLRAKELKNKVLEDFIEDEWIHPAFVPIVRKPFKRISAPVPLTIEEQEETLLESLSNQLPTSR